MMLLPRIDCQKRDLTYLCEPQRTNEWITAIFYTRAFYILTFYRDTCIISRHICVHMYVYYQSKFNLMLPFLNAYFNQVKRGAERKIPDLLRCI